MLYLLKGTKGTNLGKQTRIWSDNVHKLLYHGPLFLGVVHVQIFYKDIAINMKMSSQKLIAFLPRQVWFSYWFVNCITADMIFDKHLVPSRLHEVFGWSSTIPLVTSKCWQVLALMQVHSKESLGRVIHDSKVVRSLKCGILVSLVPFATVICQWLIE